MTLNDTKYQKNTDHFDKIGSHDWALKDMDFQILDFPALPEPGIPGSELQDPGAGAAGIGRFPSLYTQTPGQPPLRPLC